MDIVFMGTPIFCIPILNNLIKEHHIKLIVTQPDQLVGRKKEIVYSEVKNFALEHKIDIFQPEKIRKDYNKIIEINPDIIITCAYGQIISKVLLDFPKYKSINIHASLLPKLRGGAPIHKAIMNGYDKTGITIMYMNEKMDEGDILFQEEIKIDKLDTYKTLHDKLSLLASKMINPSLKLIKENKFYPLKQDNNEATYGYNVTREEEKLDFNKTSLEVYNHIRALNDKPGAYLILDNLNIKIYESEIINYNGIEKPGTILKDNDFLIKTKDNAIRILKLQLPGKNIITLKDFLNGNGKKYLIKGNLVE